MPSSPSCPPGAETSSIVIATVRSPVAGSTRVTRLPMRSVTQSMLSGPQVSSHGPASPEINTRLAELFGSPQDRFRTVLSQGERCQQNRCESGVSREHLQ